MIKRATYLLLFLWSVFAFGTAVSQAQELGVIWDYPENHNEARTHLDLFDEIGISHLELDHPVSESILDLVSEYDLKVFVRTENQFLTISDVTSSSHSLIENYEAVVEEYRTQFDVQAIGLFSNSQFYQPEFKSDFSAVLDSLYHRFNKEFYFYQSGIYFYFHRPDIPFAEEFSKKDFSKADLLEFENLLNSETAPEILFLPSKWLLNGLEEYIELKNSLIVYKENGEWLMPLPAVSKHENVFNLPVLLLLLLWLGLALLLRISPVSRPMIMRYIFSHRFFADDILHYRERSATAGLTLLAFHIIFSGLTFWILSKVLLSETGLAAFFHHLPALAVTGRNYISFFVWGMILAAVIPIISLLWIHFSSKNLQHFSQTINLYAGIFALDFILVTVMLTLFLAGIGGQVILILALIFFLFWLATFFIAAGDVAKSMLVGKFIFLTITAGVYTILLALAVLAFLSADHLRQVIDLALML